VIQDKLLGSVGHIGESQSELNLYKLGGKSLDFKNLDMESAEELSRSWGPSRFILIERHGMEYGISDYRTALCNGSLSNGLIVLPGIC
jgi:hypothetical protein